MQAVFQFYAAEITTINLCFDSFAFPEAEKVQEQRPWILPVDFIYMDITLNITVFSSVLISLALCQLCFDVRKNMYDPLNTVPIPFPMKF